MLTYYQPFLLPFLDTKRYHLPRGFIRNYFLSFEDGLWTLLQQKQIPKHSVILIPDFYCMDVVQNIRNHDYKPVYYPLDDHFQISKTKFNQYIQKHKPAVVIFFHACGISNTLLRDTRYIKDICKRAIVIEDAVHRLVDPKQIRIIHANHFIIDSLRKVLPLNGSFLYGKEPIHPQPEHLELRYILKSTYLYVLFRIIFTLGVTLRSTKIISYSHKRILKAHDDLIGDSTYGHAGHSWNSVIHQYIDFSKVEKHKARQAKLYDTFLMTHQNWYRITFPFSENKLLHAYPIGLKSANLIKTIPKIERFLEVHGAPVWFKFPDSPWSRNRAVLLLPLGFHVSYTDIQKICRLLCDVK